MLTPAFMACGLFMWTQPAGAAPAADVPLAEYRSRETGEWTLLERADARSDEVRYRRVVAALRFDLETIEHAVPPEALRALHAVRIVVTPQTSPRDGLSGRGMCYHESAQWLTSHGFDAAREGVVEICNMDDFLIWRAEQPMMVLHELAHAYHAMVGFDRKDIAEAYGAAKEAGLYRNVAYALAPEGRTRDAYALTNAKEYFAELTEAYFGRNDYFPCTHEELRRYDPAGFAMVGRIWSLPAPQREPRRP